MKNIFRKLSIPKDNVQEVTELQSWTVAWEIKTGWSGDVKRLHKVFVKKPEADEFKKQLEESAKFIHAYIKTEIKEN